MRGWDEIVNWHEEQVFPEIPTGLTEIVPEIPTGPMEVDSFASGEGFTDREAVASTQIQFGSQQEAPDYTPPVTGTRVSEIPPVRKVRPRGAFPTNRESDQVPPAAQDTIPEGQIGPETQTGLVERPDVVEALVPPDAEPEKPRDRSLIDPVLGRIWPRGAQTVTTNFDGRHYVLPLTVDGKQLTEDQAIREAISTGIHRYRSFDNVADAKRFSDRQSRSIRPLLPGPNFPSPHPSVTIDDGRQRNVHLGATEIEGRHYVIPTMVNRKQLSFDQAKRVAKHFGLHRYPSFGTAEEALQKSQELHADQPEPFFESTRDYSKFPALEKDVKEPALALEKDAKEPAPAYDGLFEYTEVQLQSIAQDYVDGEDPNLFGMSTKDGKILKQFVREAYKKAEKSGDEKGIADKAIGRVKRGSSRMATSLGNFFREYTLGGALSSRAGLARSELEVEIGLLQREYQGLEEKRREGFLPSIVEYLEMGLLGALEMAPSIFGSTVAGVSGGATGGPPGAAAAMTLFWSSQFAPGIKSDLKNLGVDNEVAKYVAAATSPVLGLIERAQILRLVPKDLSKQLQRTARKSLTAYFATIGKGLAKNWTVQMGQETSQAAIEYMVTGVTTELSGKDFPWWDRLKGSLRGLGEAAVVIPFLQIPGAAFGIYKRPYKPLSPTDKLHDAFDRLAEDKDRDALEGLPPGALGEMGLSLGATKKQIEAALPALEKLREKSAQTVKDFGDNPGQETWDAMRQDIRSQLEDISGVEIPWLNKPHAAAEKAFLESEKASRKKLEILAKHDSAAKDALFDEKGRYANEEARGEYRKKVKEQKEARDKGIQQSLQKMAGFITGTKAEPGVEPVTDEVTPTEDVTPTEQVSQVVDEGDVPVRTTLPPRDEASTLVLDKSTRSLDAFIASRNPETLAALSPETLEQIGVSPDATKEQIKAALSTAKKIRKLIDQGDQKFRTYYKENVPENRISVEKTEVKGQLPYWEYVMEGGVSDVGEVSVGDTVMVKDDPFDPDQEPKRYRVQEVRDKDTFIVSRGKGPRSVSREEISPWDYGKVTKEAPVGELQPGTRVKIGTDMGAIKDVRADGSVEVEMDKGFPSKGAWKTVRVLERNDVKKSLAVAPTVLADAKTSRGRIKDQAANLEKEGKTEAEHRKKGVDSIGVANFVREDGVEIPVVISHVESIVGDEAYLAAVGIKDSIPSSQVQFKGEPALAVQPSAKKVVDEGDIPVRTTLPRRGSKHETVQVNGRTMLRTYHRGEIDKDATEIITVQPGKKDKKTGKQKLRHYHYVPKKGVKEQPTESQFQRFKREAREVFGELEQITDLAMIDRSVELARGRARAWAKEEEGRKEDDWFKNKSVEIGDVKKETVWKRDEKTGKRKKVTRRANVQFLNDGEIIIRAFRQANVRSLVHELGHVFRRDMPSDLLGRVESELKVKDGKWTEAQEEKFARKFEAYVQTGKAPSASLKSTFESLKRWLTELFEVMSKTEKKKREVNPELSKVMELLIAGREPVTLEKGDKVQFRYGRKKVKPLKSATILDPTPETSGKNEGLIQVELDEKGEKLWIDPSVVELMEVAPEEVTPKKTPEKAEDEVEVEEKARKGKKPKKPRMAGRKTKQRKEKRELEAEEVSTKRQEGEEVPDFHGPLVSKQVPASLQAALVKLGGVDLGETERKARKFLARELKSRGLFPQKVHEALLKSKSLVDANTRKLRHSVRDFERAVRDVYKKKKMTVGETEYLNFILAGGKGDVPGPLISPLRNMRAHIDSLSKTIKDIGIEEGGLELEIDRNIGVYMHRSFEIHADPKWKSALWTDDKHKDVIEKAKVFFRGVLEKDRESMSSEEFEKEVKLKIDTYLIKQVNTPDSIRSLSVAVKNSKITEERENIPDALLALLGERKDAKVNYVTSIQKMTSLIATHQFLQEAKEIGMGSVFWSKQDRNKPDIATEMIGVGENDALHPLNGLWTFPEIKEAFESEFATKAYGNWYRVYAKGIAFSKYAKTVLSHMTQVRNLGAWPVIWLAQGNWRLRKREDGKPISIKEPGKAFHIADAFKVFAVELGIAEPGKERDKKQWRDLVLHLSKLGVLGQDVRSSELKEVMRVAVKPGLDDIIAKGMARKASRFLSALYQASDAFGKIYAFSSEKDKYAWAHPEWSKEPLGKLETHAAKIVQDTTPSYHMVPLLVKRFKLSPLIASFVSFSSETIRTTYKTIELATREMKSGNKREASIGRQRIAGLLSAYAVFSAMPLALIAKFAGGVDSGEDEAIRRMLPPWSKNASLIHLGKIFDKDGNVGYQFVDISYNDPFAYTKKIMMAFLRGEDLKEASVAALTELAEPFIGEEILTGRVLQAYDNKDEYGREIYNESDFDFTDRWDDAALDILGHLWKAIEPGTVSSIKKHHKEIVDPEGSPYQEISSHFGIRVVDFYPRRTLGFKTTGYKNDLKDANKDVRKVMFAQGDFETAGKPRDIDAIKSEYLATENKRRGYFLGFQGLISDALILGVSRDNVRSTLRDRGVSSADIYALMNDEYKPYVPKFPKESEVSEGLRKEFFKTAMNEASKSGRKLVTGEMLMLATSQTDRAGQSYDVSEVKSSADKDREAARDVLLENIDNLSLNDLLGQLNYSYFRKSYTTKRKRPELENFALQHGIKVDKRSSREIFKDLWDARWMPGTTEVLWKRRSELQNLFSK